jgi:AcrR family transcriptional regulator
MRYCTRVQKGIKRRDYHSPRRTEQARATRRAVLDAARALFVERGDAAATIEAVAERAEVSPETVYSAFGSKRAVLSDLIDVTIAADDAPVPILERPWVDAMRKEHDPRRRLRILARNGRLMLDRWADVAAVLASAAAADPKIAELWERNKEQRLTGQRALLRMATEGTNLREGLSREAAADVLFAVGSPEVYRMLVVDRAWSPARFERWYADTLERLLLPPA